MANTIGTNIRALRQGAGLTQELLASKAGIATRVLQRIESGKSNTKIGTLEAIAEVLGCHLSALFFEKEVSSLRYDPSAEELSRIIHALVHAEPERRLLGLYLLTGDESYYQQALQLPDAAPIVRVLKKSL